MRRSQALAAPLALLALLTTGTAHALQKESQSAAPRPQVAQSSPGAPALALASRMAGLEVHDAQDGELGKVIDTVVDPQGGVVLLVERAGGGIVGLPLDVLRLRVPGDPADDARPGEPARDPDELEQPPPLLGLTLTADAGRLRSAPTVEGKALDAIDEAWLSKARAHWRDPAASKEPAKPTAADGSLHPEGRPYSDALPGVAERAKAEEKPAAPPASPPTPVFRAAALGGKDIASPTGEGVGEVEDVVVNLPEAKVAYVVIDMGGFLGMGSVHHGVPLEALRFGGRDEGLVLARDDWKSLDSRPGIDLENLPAQPSLEATPAAPAAPEQQQQSPSTDRRP